MAQVTDALHPQIHSAAGHLIDWLVLSAHLLLNRAIRVDFPKMCTALVTLGRMSEKAFETKHQFSSGALQGRAQGRTQCTAHTVHLPSVHVR